MSNESTFGKESDERHQVEAAYWRTYLTENRVETSTAFEAWLAADPGNRAAWQQMQVLWDCFGEHATSPELLVARRAALDIVSTTSSRRWARVGLTARIRIRAVAAAALLLATGSLLVWTAGSAEVYETPIGERRTVTLADGSQVALDSQSKVRVAFSSNAREIILIRGQARFSVAHYPARPFTVVAAQHKVVATGTVFNVDMLGSTLFVTLLNGHAVVVPNVSDEGGRQSFPQGIELTVGEQLQAAASSPPSVRKVNLEMASAWEHGRLVLVDEPLSTVAMRISRYSNRTLQIADRQTAELRISGVFNAGDLDGFVTTICSYLPILAETHADSSINLRHR